MTTKPHAQIARRDDFERVLPLLTTHLDPSLERTTWQRLFDYHWQGSEDYCGYMLIGEERVLGFLGMIFSERKVKGQVVPFCNITSLVVEPEYRSNTVFLLNPLRRLRDHTITDLTPNAAVCRLLEELGFQDLDRRVALLLPFRNLVSSRRLFITHHPAEMRSELHEDDAVILEAHQPYPHCRFFLLREGNAYCFVVYTVVTSLRRPHCHIQYVSNPELFGRMSGVVRRELVRAAGTPYVLLDSRFARQLPASARWILPFTWRKMFRSRNVRPEQIDNLFSELILLNIRSVPTRAELWESIRGR